MTRDELAARYPGLAWDMLERIWERVWVEQRTVTTYLDPWRLDEIRDSVCALEADKIDSREAGRRPTPQRVRDLIARLLRWETDPEIDGATTLELRNERMTLQAWMQIAARNGGAAADRARLAKMYANGNYALSARGLE